jgi:hypothetical protein
MAGIVFRTLVRYFLFCLTTLVTPISSFGQQSSVPGQSPARLASVPPPSISLFDTLAEQGLSLRQSVDGAGASKGASFAYDRESGNIGGFKSAFALTLVRPLNGPADYSHPEIFLWAGVDGNLSTGTFKKNTFLNARPQIGGVLPLNTTPAVDKNCFFDPSCSGEAISHLATIIFRSGPDFEATQDFKVKNMLFEINATPVYGHGAINSYAPIAEFLSYRISPYIDFQTGTNLSGRTSTVERQKTRLRIAPILGVEFDDFGYFANQLGLKNIMLSLNEQITALPLENKSLYNLFTGSLDFYVSDDISFGPSVSIGQSPPTFQRNTAFLLTLKVGFGRDPMLSALPAPKF